MSELEAARADHPVVPMRQALTTFMAVFGALGLVIALISSLSWAAAVGVVVTSISVALFWGLLMWAAFRARAARDLERLPVVAGPATGSRRRALLHGVRVAVILTVAPAC